jgi:hypothetical protein
VVEVETAGVDVAGCATVNNMIEDGRLRNKIDDNDDDELRVSE